LRPILENLDSARKNIVSSLELLTNYPFPTTVTNAVHGDYTGLYASISLNLNDLIRGLTSSQAGGGPLGPLTTQAPTQQNPLQGVLPNNGTGGVVPQTPKDTGLIPNLTGASTTGPGGSDYTRVILQGMGAK
jgi:hypothetical protein